MAHSGISSGVYSFNIPPPKSYIAAKDVNYTIPSNDAGVVDKEFNITLIFPVYSSSSTSLSLRLYLLFHYPNEDVYSNITYEKTFSLSAGMNDVFFNETTKVPWWVEGGNDAYIYRVVLQFYSSSGSGFRRT